MEVLGVILAVLNESHGTLCTWGYIYTRHLRAESYVTEYKAPWVLSELVLHGHALSHRLSMGRWNMSLTLERVVRLWGISDPRPEVFKFGDPCWRWHLRPPSLHISKSKPRCTTRQRGCHLSNYMLRTVQHLYNRNSADALSTDYLVFCQISETLRTRFSAGLIADIFYHLQSCARSLLTQMWLPLLGVAKFNISACFHVHKNRLSLVLLHKTNPRVLRCSHRACSRTGLFHKMSPQFLSGRQYCSDYLLSPSNSNVEMAIHSANGRDPWSYG